MATVSLLSRSSAYFLKIVCVKNLSNLKRRPRLCSIGFWRVLKLRFLNWPGLSSSNSNFWYGMYDMVIWLLLFSLFFCYLGIGYYLSILGSEHLFTFRAYSGSTTYFSKSRSFFNLSDSGGPLL